MVTRAWYSPRGHYVAWYLSEQHGTPLMGHYVAWYQCGIRPHIFTTCPRATGVDAPPHPTKYFSSFVFCNHFQGLLCICDSWLLNDVFCNVTRRNAMHCNGKYRICKVLKLWREALCPGIVSPICHPPTPYLPDISILILPNMCYLVLIICILDSSNMIQNMIFLGRIKALRRSNCIRWEAGHQSWGFCKITRQ